MTSVCIYFQVHQPFRLKRYSVFDTHTEYFDPERNRDILDKIASRCYLPSTELLLKLARKHDGRFRVAFSLTGIVIEQWKQWCPRALDVMKELVDTGCVELLGETYHHSLAFLYSRDEFRAQVELHAELMKETFGVTPTVFRNTELIYNNELASYLAGWKQYRGILTEGADHVLDGQSPNHVYRPPGLPDMGLLLKNYKLSDDVAFRFSNKAWAEWPLTSEKYARWLTEEVDGPVCGLFMDYETFGEHQWAETGIFDFLETLPDELFKLDGDHTFATPSQCLDAHEPVGEYDVPHMISWADTERDLSAWLGNAMQSNAAHELYKLEATAKACRDRDVLRDWRRLTTSDHFYYMCTKYFADGDVHKYFNPYESPYDSYINFMNVMDNLRTRVDRATRA